MPITLLQNSSFILIISLLICLHQYTAIADNFTIPYPNSNTSISQGSHIAKPGCHTKCGNLTVPFPFGIGRNSGCSINPFFEITCNTSFDPPKAFLASFSDLEVFGIYDTKIWIKNNLSYACYEKDGNSSRRILYDDFSMNLTGTPFSFSTENKVTVVGCDDVSLLSLETSILDSEFGNFVSSCVAICNKTQDLSNGSCSGIGCCQSSIPKGLQSIDLQMSTLDGHFDVYSFNPCGYSFLTEENSYMFHVSDVLNSSFLNKTIDKLPLVIDWEIGNQNCGHVHHTNDFACKENSECVDSETGLGGYRCSCSQGYEGNPYLSPGCQDIDECKLYSPCHPKANCKNLQGTYNCTCFYGYFGDGRLDGIGCLLIPSPSRTQLYAGLLIGSGFFIALPISFWSYKVLRKRRKNKTRHKFFRRNGGLVLKKQMSDYNQDHVLGKMKIFTAKDLERATDRFNKSRILGRGGQGTVYKGMLSDGRIVAVKKSKQVGEEHLEEFINEVVILSQINHRNVVKLLGCCLETEVPSLVYEFIPNGNLYDLIHDDSTGFPFTWCMRLRIAVEVANALAYLHHAISVPIYHRDMKSNSILLDEKYRAKLSDFGISRSVAVDKNHLTTKVKGTFGYLDPEYFQTSKFTEKSDVYSFGVVLIELLTRKKPISSSPDEEEKSLVTRFLSTMEENRLKTILDPQIMEQGVVKEEHVAVANLAWRCLNMNGKKRPNMKEVATELESVTTCENPSFVSSNVEDVSCSMTESPERFSDDFFMWPPNDLFGQKMKNGVNTPNS